LSNIPGDQVCNPYHNVSTSTHQQQDQERTRCVLSLSCVSHQPYYTECDNDNTTSTHYYILLAGLGHPTITIPILLTTGCFDSYCISRNPIFLIFTALYLDETPNSNFPKNPRLSSFWEWQLHFPNSPNFAQNSNSDFDSNFLRISKLSYNPPCLWSS
jgi:hypothetical protein